MPLDTRIPLMGQPPPQIQSPLESYARTMSLQNMIQQGQLQQQEMQQNQMRLRMMQQQAEDSETARQILSKHGGDIDKAQPEILSALGDRGLAYVKSANDTREAIAKAKKADLDRMESQLNIVASAAGSILSVPEEQRPDIYRQVVSNLPQEIQGMAPPEYPGENVLLSFLHSAMDPKSQIAERRQKLVDEEAARHNKAVETETARHNVATEGQENYQNVEIVDKKSPGGHRSALFAPKAGKYFEPDTKAEIPGAQRFYQQAQGGVTLMVPNEAGGYTVTRAQPGQNVAGGTLTPSGMSSLNVPTAATRSMAERAPRVLHFVDRLTDLINQNEKSLGPLSGRWSQFKTGRIGLKNQGYARMRTDAGLLETALMNMHVGARGGQQIMEHFHNLIGLAVQDPENLKAALDEIRAYAQEVASEGQNKGLGATGTGPKVGVVEDGYRFKGGDPSDPSRWEKVNP